MAINIEIQTDEELNIESLRIQNRQITLKPGLLLEDLSEFVKHFIYVNEYILEFDDEVTEDSKDSEWTKEKFFEFLKWRNQFQRAFLKILLRDRYLSKEKMLQEIKKYLKIKVYDGHDLRGALSGMSRSINAYYPEQELYYTHYEPNGIYYQINDECESLLNEVFNTSEKK